MKKNVKNRLFEQRYNNVMKRLGIAVRHILESEIHDTGEDDVYKIENISELTLEDFYDPSMNASFANYKDNCIFRRGNKIGFGVKIIDDDNNARVFTIFRDSFGKALEDFLVIINASINNLNERFYKFRISEVVKKFFNAFRNVITDEMEDEFDERVDDFYYKCFANAESVDDVVKGIKKMEKVNEMDDDVYKIKNISDLTLEDFYNPSMNASFANYKDNCILCRGNKIGFAVRVIDLKTDDERVITIFRDSFGKALEDYDVICQALISHIGDYSIDFRFNEVIKKFFKAYRDIITDELFDEIDERADDLYYKYFDNAESVDDVVMGIKKMENNF